MVSIIKDGQIVTLDGENRIIKDGAIAIDDDRIIDIGGTTRILNKYHADTLIKGEGKLVLPGLINAHTHMCRSLLRGKSRYIPLERFLEYVHNYRANMTEKEIEIGTLLSSVEMVKSGITCFLSHQNPRFIKRAIKSSSDTGLKGIFARILMDDLQVPMNLKETPEEAVQNTLKLVNETNIGTKIMFGPMGLHNCSVDLMKKVGKANQKVGIGIHTHVAETRENKEKIWGLYGQSEIEILRDAGILGPKTMLIHCTHITDQDIEIIRKTNTSVVYCPSSSSSNGIVSKLLQMGVNVALGSDGPSNSHSLFSDMRKCAKLNASLQPLDILKMATTSGAKALGMEKDIGSLEVGKKADIIIVDVCKDDPLSEIVYSIQDVDVRDVIIDGEFVVQNRAFLCFSEEEFINRALKYIKIYGEKTIFRYNWSMETS